jgi:hypothetical protein
MEKPMTTLDQARWSFFLRALAQEVDAYGGAEGRDAVLRGVGKRLAQMLPLPVAESLQAVELEINATLAAFGWGECVLELQEAERRILIRHTGLPLIGSSGEPAGFWLGAALEGLYSAWLINHPACGDGFSAQRHAIEAGGCLVLRFQKTMTGG